VIAWDEGINNHSIANISNIGIVFCMFSISLSTTNIIWFSTIANRLSDGENTYRYNVVCRKFRVWPMDYMYLFTFVIIIVVVVVVIIIFIFFSFIVIAIAIAIVIVIVIAIVIVIVVVIVIFVFIFVIIFIFFFYLSERNLYIKQ